MLCSQNGLIIKLQSFRQSRWVLKGLSVWGIHKKFKRLFPWWHKNMNHFSIGTCCVKLLIKLCSCVKMNAAYLFTIYIYIIWRKHEAQKHKNGIERWSWDEVLNYFTLFQGMRLMFMHFTRAFQVLFGFFSRVLQVFSLLLFICVKWHGVDWSWGFLLFY